MEKDSDARGGTRRREGGTKETPDPGSGKYVEERKEPTCGSHLTHHTHLSEWAESGRWVENTQPIYIYMPIMKWLHNQSRLTHFCGCLFNIPPLWQSHTHAPSQTHSVFVPRIHPQLQPTLWAFRKWCHVSNAHHHPLPFLPASHTHSRMHIQTQWPVPVFFFSPFLLVHSFLSFIFVQNVDNL